MEHHAAHAIEMMRDHPFFSELPADLLAPLAKHAHSRTIAAGEVLFREGETADRFFLLHTGEIALDMEDPDRGQLRVDILGADAVLGWSWLFSPYRWHLTATALQRTVLVEFDAFRLRAYMSEQPAVGYELMHRFAALLFDRLQATRRRLSD